MPFDNLPLDPILIRGLTRLGYREPTPIQAQAIPAALDGRDLIALAPTGTGKTAAYLAPVAHHLLAAARGRGEPGGSGKPPRRKGKRQRGGQPRRRTHSGVQALVLCPTRELAEQVAREASNITRGSILRIACAFGGVSINPQAEAIAAGAHVLIATPGRARDLLEQGRLTLAAVSRVVLDEADRMLDMGFLPQVEAILERVPSPRQMLLFSATMPGPVATLAERFMHHPVRVQVTEQPRPASHVTQRLIFIEDDDKTPMLLHLLRDRAVTGVLVFARTRRRVGWVSAALHRNGVTVAALHGDRSQHQRQRALADFASGRVRVLVATDVAARGLHVESVRTVINYDLPNDPEEFIHRVGRAGHGGQLVSPEHARGEAWAFVSQDERTAWRSIVNALELSVDAESVPGFAPAASPRGKGMKRPAPSRPGKPIAELVDGARDGRPSAGSSAAPPARPRKGRKHHAASGADLTVKGARLRRRRHPGRPGARQEKPGGGVKRPPGA
ncbi:MAG: DEAD/DEAH box helicase [Phycisphaeraceae bacterium]|nr:MAG: DEAD/DEAH box helicase [Phycisphaeraceae bacterium]